MKKIQKYLLLMCIPFAILHVQPLEVHAQNEEKDVVSNIGSISKTFVTAAVLQLAEEGKVDLDEPVVTYLPEFTLQDERYRDITVRMLMNHTSGLMGTTYGDSFLFEDNDMTCHDMLLNQLAKGRLKADPGAYSTYCNDGFWLLELLVEEVSGETFTDYLANHISKPLRLSQTGTPVDQFQTPKMIDIYRNGNRVGHEYVMDIGSGGIISSASDLCQYGTAYFWENNVLLSKESKQEMYQNYAKDSYESPYGLGWDFVEDPQFEAAGVQVLEKGGSTAQQFSSLLVAPKEEISIAVLSSGSNPMGSTMMARNLMELALEEKGITVPEVEITEPKTTDGIPEHYKAYEGYYAMGSQLIRLSFPNDSSLLMEECDVINPKNYYFRYTEDGKFVRMDGDGPDAKQDKQQEILDFVAKSNGKIYLVSETMEEIQGFGIYANQDYLAEKIEETGIDQKTLEELQKYEGTYHVLSGKYSNMNFSHFSVDFTISKACPGYLIDRNGTLKMTRIKDTNHAESFLQLPGSQGRDLSDVTLQETEDGIFLVAEDFDVVMIKDSCMDTFSTEITEVETRKDSAKWYLLSEETKGATISFDRSDKTSVYVLDRFGNQIYSSYLLDWPNEVVLPSEGKIMFAGETGEKIGITFIKK